MSIRGPGARADFARAATEHREDFGWLETNHESLEACVARARPGSEDATLVDLWRAVDTWLSLSGRWAELRHYRDPAMRAAKRLHRFADLAEMLLSAAELDDRLGNTARARELITEAVRNASKGDDDKILAQATDRLGVVSNDPGLVAEAWRIAEKLQPGAVPAYVAYDYAGLHPVEEEAYLARALRIARLAPPGLEATRAEAFVLTAQAVGASARGALEEAESLAVAGLALKRRIHDRPSSGNSLLVLAGIELERRDFRAAQSAASEARDLFDELGLLDRAADSVWVCGRALEAMQSWTEAENAYERALEWFSSRPGVETGLLWRDIGDVRSGAGKRAEAVEAYERAVALLRTASEPAEAARVLLSATLLERRHDDARARGWADEAEELAETTSDKRLIAQALFTTATFAQDESISAPKLQRSWRYLQDAPPVEWERMTVAAALVRQLETWHLRARDGLQREIDAQRESIARPASGAKAAEAARLLTVAGDLDSAEQVLRRAQRLKAPTADIRVATHALARAFERDDDYERAARLYKQALRLTPTDESRLRGVVLHDLGDVYGALGDGRGALHYYRRSARAKAGDSRRVDQARTQRKLAEVALALGERREATRAIARARSLLAAEGPDAGEWSLRSALARLESELVKASAPAVGAPVP